MKEDSDILASCLLQSLGGKKEIRDKEEVLAQASRPALAKAQEIMEKCAKKGVHMLGIFSAQYPRFLREIFQAPAMLFYRGILPENFAELHGMAIVGSRRASLDSLHIAKSMAKSLADSGLTVVSGLAIGVDAAAHAGALLGAGSPCPSIGILGSSLDLFYPRQNERLAQDMLEHGGLVLSEYAPGTPAQPHQFLQRNRIIAGLSLGCLVIEAGEKSGSLVTARHAMDEGRDVFVVPGSLRGSSFSGSHRLIQSGAKLVTHVSDILEEYGLSISVTPAVSQEGRLQHCAPTSMQKFSGDEAVIMQALQDGGLWAYEELQKKSGLGKGFDQALLQLELGDAIIRHPGNTISISPEFI